LTEGTIEAGKPDWADEEFFGRDSIIVRDHRAGYEFAAGHLRKSFSVLDVGCAYGYGTALLAERAGEVIGVDHDRRNLEKARRKYASVKNASFAYCELPQGMRAFPSASFDTVVCLQAIEHVPDYKKLVAEFARVLKPSGIAVISTPNKLTSPGINEYHVCEFTKEELDTLLLATRFGERQWFGQGSNAFFDRRWPRLVLRRLTMPFGYDPVDYGVRPYWSECLSLYAVARKQAKP